MIRFFIVFLFLALSSFSYATTYTYYQSSDQAMCDVAKESVCLYNFNKTFPVTTFAPNSYTSVTINNLGCSSVASSNGYPTKYNKLTVETVGTPPETFTRSYTSSGETGTTAIPRALDCPVGYKIELIGCNAKCVPENQCSSKAGQTEQRIAQCGLGTGTNCRYLDTPNAGDSKTYVCDNRTFQWLPLGGTYNVAGCEATVTNQTPLVKSNGNHEINDVFNGSGSVPLNCELTLTLTGNDYKSPTDGTTPPKTSPKDPITGGSKTSHTNDGTGGTPNTGGTGGLNPRENSTPDSNTGGGSGGTCTITGQTQVNGSCQCPSGQTVQNNQCTTTTNTGGGNAGGGDNSTCDPTKSICEGSGDGSAQTGDITKPQKIENTITGSWWESKYQDGMTGVWNKHKANFDNTPFVQQLNTMKNGAPNSGTCPSFDFQFLQYGGTLQPPCLIWPALKAFFLFMTLMLCRRIIFGG